MAVRSAAWRTVGLALLMSGSSRMRPSRVLVRRVSARLLDRAIHEALDPRVAREVVVDVSLGHFLADLELPRQPEGAHPVDDAEIDGLGLPPQLGGDLAGIDLEDFRGRPGVDVLLFPERLGSGSRPPSSGPGCAARSGSSRPTAGAIPGGARRRGGSRRPSSVRMGMFCRFGSELDSRPVAVTVWL